MKYFKNIYNLRNSNEFNISLVKTVYNGLESLSYLGPKVWSMLPVERREIESLLEFKTKIKDWNRKSCPCGISKNYICNVGYV